MEFICGRQFYKSPWSTHITRLIPVHTKRTSHGDAERVVAVRWTSADEFAEALLADSRLTQMLKEVMLRECEIRVDPLDDHI